MNDLLKFVTKVAVGSTAIGAGAVLVKKGLENGKNLVGKKEE